MNEWDRQVFIAETGIDPVDEGDKQIIQLTKITCYCVKFGNDLVMFHGEHDSDGNIYSEHNGQVYRLTVKTKDRKVDE